MWPTFSSGAVAPIPARWYTDPEVVAEERMKVFLPSWQLGCLTSDIPSVGSYIATSLLGEPLIVVRSSAVKISAFPNICLHRGASIADGVGVCESFRCSYHGWRYDLSGRRIGGGAGSLQQMSVVEVPPFVLINQGSNPSSPAFGDLIDALAARDFVVPKDIIVLEYQVRANWKLVVENFNECYHCPIVHATTLAKRVDLARYQVIPNGDTAVHAIEPTSSDGPLDLSTSRNAYFVFPNWAITITANALITFEITPLSESQSRITRRFLFEDHPNDEHAQIVNYYDQVMVEDIQLLEVIQRNLRSVHVRISGPTEDRERGAIWFRERLAAALTVSK